eukprot:403373484
MLETKTSQINQSLLQSSDSQDDKLSQQQNNLKEKQAPPGSQLLQSNSTDSSNLQYDFKFQDKKVTPTIKSILEVDYGPEEYRSSFIKSKCQVVIILQGYEEECIYLQNLETQEILSKWRCVRVGTTLFQHSKINIYYQGEKKKVQVMKRMRKRMMTKMKIQMMIMMEAKIAFIYTIQMIFSFQGQIQIFRQLYKEDLYQDILVIYSYYFRLQFQNAFLRQSTW